MNAENVYNAWAKTFYDRNKITSASVCLQVLNSLMWRIGMICDKYILNQCKSDHILKLQCSVLTKQWPHHFITVGFAGSSVYLPKGDNH